MAAIDTIKRSRIAKLFYHSPRLVSAYHRFWAWFGAVTNGHPSKKIFVIGVTGTKGKTTTLELLNAMLEAAGRRTALLSSLRVKIGATSEKNNLGNTMPGHGYIQKFLKRALGAQCTYALVEVASQGIVSHRHEFIDWKVGVLTNLAPEHIESHGSFENYRKAKLDFLKYVLARGGAVFLNRDDQHFPFFNKVLENQKTVPYSKDDKGLKNYFSKIESPHFARRGSAPKFVLTDFNRENAAAAATVAKILGIDETAIERALGSFEGVPGRMEFMTKGPYTAIVDYAHTPDSLEAAYVAARPKPNANYPNARLICVLGAAGGGRDKWKRPEFGRIAGAYCDEIILTTEDPYDEDPAEIIQEIKSGILSEDAEAVDLYEVPDRREAIKKAVALARPGDVVIGTGKGSEDWIHVARGQKISWSERRAFEEALEEKEYN
ncbi:MAG: UDP-N-acetylmuramyl-tripeptide synthetase [Minisyncoccia bacterium]|jgi:UDP-N-acetylmuramoyl-L-alanyl-D-glutamate--2,6-diaminopimelate ligase